jgi:uncharacterized protein YecE (DUF72 family)
LEVPIDTKNQFRFYVGCSGWSYTSWKGHFYPSNLDNSQWLSHYSQIFDYVEIDSSFYRTPNIFMVRNWYKKTSEDFRFTAKFPKIITHDKRLKDVEKELEYLFEAIRPLHDKTLALLIQLPPSLNILEGLERLKELLPLLDNNFRYAVEVRNKSWFNELAYTFFANNNICLVWSQLADIQTPPVVTTDFVYLRLIGDRTIIENEFGKIQKDRTVEMQYWANKLKVVEEEEAADQIKLAIVSANNHYAGFGPASANLFRGMMNLNPLNWEIENKIIQTTTTAVNSNQRSLSDFL